MPYFYLNPICVSHILPGVWPSLGAWLTYQVHTLKKYWNSSWLLLMAVCTLPVFSWGWEHAQWLTYWTLALREYRLSSQQLPIANTFPAEMGLRVHLPHLCWDLCRTWACTGLVRPIAATLWARVYSCPPSRKQFVVAIHHLWLFESFYPPPSPWSLCLLGIKYNIDNPYG